ncbi:MAG: preprotein translocase subunit SecG [Myxococcaceae bacterium]|nr:preprotein translocase subunit SecG [Myxococcaceae bacterium]
MEIFASVVHVLLCIFMIFVILLQPGKDAGMGAALGGGAATTAFGGRGAVTFLSKITAVCASAFFLTSLGLSFVGLRTSVASGITAPKSAPAAAVADAGTKVPEVPAAPAPTDTTGSTGTPAPGTEAASAEGSAIPSPAAPAGEAKKPGTPEQPK